jgi:hypothetical protein
MIFEELCKTGIKIVDDESLSAFLDLILERVNKSIDDTNFIRQEFKERVKFKIYKEVHR